MSDRSEPICCRYPAEAELQAGYPAEYSSVNPAVVRSALGRLGIRPGGAVLDVGCGDGRFSRDLLRGALGGQARRVVGVDYCRARIEAARARGLEAAEFHLEDIHAFIDCAIQRPVFSLVVCLEVLEHLEDPRALVLRLPGVLIPGGVIFASVPIAMPHERHLHTWSSAEAAAHALWPDRYITVNEMRLERREWCFMVWDDFDG